MTITMNGDRRTVDDTTTVAQLVDDVAGDGTGIAVAVNDAVVPRGSWSTIVLDDGDRVEVLSATAGG